MMRGSANVHSTMPSPSQILKGVHMPAWQVRDRATFFVALLQSLATGARGIGGLDAMTMLRPLAVPLEALETSVKSYMYEASDEVSVDSTSISLIRVGAATTDVCAIVRRRAAFFDLARDRRP